MLNKQGKNKIDWCDYTFNIISGKCQHNCNYCLDGNTYILMADCSQKILSKVRIGDEIIGLSKVINGYRRFIKANILAKIQTSQIAYQITLIDGTVLVCSADHKWLSNRGWKYTTRKRCGNNQRPYLTTKNKMRGFGKILQTPPKTDLYRCGYLSGMIRGDGTLKIYDYSNKNNSYQHHFRLALIDLPAINRTEHFLKFFGIETHRFDFGKGLTAIRNHSESAFYLIKDLIKFRDSKEFYRGFLAGIFDAEGSLGNGNSLRIFNSNKGILNAIEKALVLFGFNFKYDVIKNNNVETIRIIGGIKEFLRFYSTTNPAIKRKLILVNRSLKNNIPILSIEPLNKKISMYDITTSSKNFIANGIISHNCYMHRFWRFPGNSEIQFKEHYLKNKMPKKPSRIFIGSSTDMWGSWIPAEWIQSVLDFCESIKHCTYLFLTKNPKRYGDFRAIENGWYGTTVDGTERTKKNIRDLVYYSQVGMAGRFISFEPLLAPVEPDLFGIQWIIIGADSNKGAEKPPDEWADRLIELAREENIAIWVKDNFHYHKIIKELPK